MVGLDLAANHMLVQYCTTGGDGTCSRGIEDAFTKFLGKLVRIERLSDTVHLGQTQFRRGVRANFSKTMFSPEVRDKSEAQKCFASAIAIRADIVFKSLFKRYHGNTELIGDKLAESVDKVIACFDDCERCTLETTGCDGAEISWWTNRKLNWPHGIRCTKSKHGQFR